MAIDIEQRTLRSGGQESTITRNLKTSSSSSTLSMPRNTLNKNHKHGSVMMLYITLGILALILSFVLAQAVHHAQPDARPHGTLHRE